MSSFHSGLKMTVARTVRPVSEKIRSVGRSHTHSSLLELPCFQFTEISWLPVGTAASQQPVLSLVLFQLFACALSETTKWGHLGEWEEGPL